MADLAPVHGDVLLRVVGCGATSECLGDRLLRVRRVVLGHGALFPSGGGVGTSHSDESITFSR